LCRHLQPDKHTRKKTTKITKEKREKHKWELAGCDHVKILQAYENKISYTLEDGLVGRNIWRKTVKTNTIKLHADGNMQYPLYNTLQQDAKIWYYCLRCLSSAMFLQNSVTVPLIPVQVTQK
jgi:hypothetical protein